MLLVLSARVFTLITLVGGATWRPAEQCESLLYSELRRRSVVPMPQRSAWEPKNVAPFIRSSDVFRSRCSTGGWANQFLILGLGHGQTVCGESLDGTVATALRKIPNSQSE